MKVNIYVIADTYNSAGWSLNIIPEDDAWRVDYNEKRKDAKLLTVLDIPDVTEKDLVQIGTAKVDEMKDELTDQVARTKERIKEFEAKFLLLDIQPEDVS